MVKDNLKNLKNVLFEHLKGAHGTLVFCITVVDLRSKSLVLLLGCNTPNGRVSAYLNMLPLAFFEFIIFVSKTLKIKSSFTLIFFVQQLGTVVSLLIKLQWNFIGKFQHRNKNEKQKSDSGGRFRWNAMQPL